MTELELYKLLLKRLKEDDLCVCCLDNDEEVERVADAILELVSKECFDDLHWSTR